MVLGPAVENPGVEVDLACGRVVESASSGAVDVPVAADEVMGGSDVVLAAGGAVSGDSVV